MSVWLWSGYFLVLLFVILGMPFIDHHLKGWETALGIFFTVVVACLPLLGVYVFYPDQQRRSFLFLTERGVRPSYVWWSRQLAGLAVPLLLGIIFYVCVLIPSNVHNNFAFLPFWEFVQLQAKEYSADRLSLLRTIFSVFLPFAGGLQRRAIVRDVHSERDCRRILQLGADARHSRLGLG